DVHAVRVAGAGEDAHRLGGEGPADGVDRVAADVEQAAAAQGGLEADVGRVGRPQQEGEGAGDALHPAERAAVEELARPGGARVVRPHEAVHQADALGPAVVHQVAGLGGGRGQRLLTQDVPAAVGGAAGPLGVERVGERDVHRVHGGVVEQGVVTAVRPR